MKEICFPASSRYEGEDNVGCFGNVVLKKDAKKKSDRKKNK